MVLQTLKARAPRDQIEQLVSDLREKLSDPDKDLDFADAPISTLVSRVCQALGVEPDWTGWEDEDWAQEEAEDWTPGSPYPLPSVPARAADEDEAEVEAGGP